MVSLCFLLKSGLSASQTTPTGCRANKPQLPQGDAQGAAGPLLPVLRCSAEWEGPRRSFPGWKGHCSINKAQPEPPSPASPYLTKWLLTIFHLSYRLDNIVCHLRSHFDLGNFKKQRRCGFFILILLFWCWGANPKSCTC